MPSTALPAPVTLSDDRIRESQIRPLPGQLKLF